jgi:hypothetical protein
MGKKEFKSKKKLVTNSKELKKKTDIVVGSPDPTEKMDLPGQSRLWRDGKHEDSKVQ